MDEPTSAPREASPVHVTVDVSSVSSPPLPPPPPPPPQQEEVRAASPATSASDTPAASAGASSPVKITTQTRTPTPPPPPAVPAATSPLLVQPAPQSPRPVSPQRSALPQVLPLVEAPRSTPLSDASTADASPVPVPVAAPTDAPGITTSTSSALPQSPASSRDGAPTPTHHTPTSTVPRTSAAPVSVPASAAPTRISTAVPAAVPAPVPVLPAAAPMAPAAAFPMPFMYYPGMLAGFDPTRPPAAGVQPQATALLGLPIAEKPRAHLELRQSLPFVRLVSSMMPPAVDTIPLFIDGDGIAHFFAGNKRSALFCQVTLVDDALSFRTNEPDPVVVVTWSYAAEEDDPDEPHAQPGAGGGNNTAMFKVSEAALVDNKTVVVRLTMGQHSAAQLRRLFHFQVLVRAGNTVLGVQSSRIKVLSKPSRVLVSGHTNFRTPADLVKRWPSLGQVSTGVVSSDTEPVAIEVVPPISAADAAALPVYDAPLHRNLLIAMLQQRPPGTMHQDHLVFVLDFETAARCGRFVADCAAGARAEGIELILAPRRPRSLRVPYPIRHALCHWDPTTSPQPTFQRLNSYWNLTGDTQPQGHEDAALQSLIVAMGRKAEPVLQRHDAIVQEVQPRPPIPGAKIMNRGKPQAQAASTSRAAPAAARSLPAGSGASSPQPPAASAAVGSAKPGAAPVPARLVPQMQAYYGPALQTGSLATAGTAGASAGAPGVAPAAMMYRPGTWPMMPMYPTPMGYPGMIPMGVVPYPVAGMPGMPAMAAAAPAPATDGKTGPAQASGESVGSPTAPPGAAPVPAPAPAPTPSAAATPVSGAAPAPAGSAPMMMWGMPGMPGMPGMAAVPWNYSYPFMMPGYGYPGPWGMPMDMATLAAASAATTKSSSSTIATMRHGSSPETAMLDKLADVAAQAGPAPPVRKRAKDDDNDDTASESDVDEDDDDDDDDDDGDDGDDVDVDDSPKRLVQVNKRRRRA